LFEYVQNPKNGGQLKLGGLAPSNLELALVKQYPFDSAVQRMTVVAKKKGTPAYSVFIKGAPEKVASLCRPNTSEAESYLFFVCRPNTSEAESFLFCVPPKHK
jgi:magnesium-transporting ATPase (P-type)